jgi:uncharacterized protein YndB with AHSA1/START domain
MATHAITRDEDAIVVEVQIAPPEQVSDPSRLLRWWGQRGIYHSTKWCSDLRPGGQWRSGRRFHLPSLSDSV